MKTITCRQMGGPCDMPIHGETAEEMMKNGAKHIQESSDEGHKKVLAMMEEMQKDPQSGKQWNDDFAKKFQEAPED